MSRRPTCLCGTCQRCRWREEKRTQRAARAAEMTSMDTTTADTIITTTTPQLPPPSSPPPTDPEHVYTPQWEDIPAAAAAAATEGIDPAELADLVDDTEAEAQVDELADLQRRAASLDPLRAQLVDAGMAYIEGQRAVCESLGRPWPGLGTPEAWAMASLFLRSNLSLTAASIPDSWLTARSRHAHYIVTGVALVGAPTMTALARRAAAAEGAAGVDGDDDTPTPPVRPRGATIAGWGD